MEAEAAYIDTFGAGIDHAKRRVWPVARSACSAVIRALAASARDDAFDRRITTSWGAGFATLPRGEQNRLLDRGFRP